MNESEYDLFSSNPKDRNSKYMNDSDSQAGNSQTKPISKMFRRNGARKVIPVVSDDDSSAGKDYKSMISSKSIKKTKSKSKNSFQSYEERKEYDMSSDDNSHLNNRGNKKYM
jgi:hypothetical protein